MKLTEMKERNLAVKPATSTGILVKEYLM